MYLVLSNNISSLTILSNSKKSASALTGLVFLSSDSNVIFALLFNRAPLHLLGLYGLIGVNAKTWAPTGITGPLRDRL